MHKQIFAKHKAKKWVVGGNSGDVQWGLSDARQKCHIAPKRLG